MKLDGLALSSRNRHLTPHERCPIAPVLSRALRCAAATIERGERSVAVIKQRSMVLFEPFPEARVEYFEIVDPLTLQPLEFVTGQVLIAAAMWLGATRLIDNGVIDNVRAGTAA